MRPENYIVSVERQTFLCFERTPYSRDTSLLISPRTFNKSHWYSPWLSVCHAFLVTQERFSHTQTRQCTKVATRKHAEPLSWIWWYMKKKSWSLSLSHLGLLWRDIRLTLTIHVDKFGRVIWQTLFCHRASYHGQPCCTQSEREKKKD